MIDNNQITKRDLFAAMAMQGMLAAGRAMSFRVMAQQAKWHAAALIEELDNKFEPKNEEEHDSITLECENCKNDTLHLAPTDDGNILACCDRCRKTMLTIEIKTEDCIKPETLRGDE